MKPIVIIGSGLAGYTAAREFRRLDKTTSLIIITADDGSFYSKPMLSNAFAQNKQPGQLISQTAAQMAAQLDAQIMTGTQVSEIDTSGKRIATSTGFVEYGKLVLAVGAQPIRLPMAGDGAEEILSINHLADYAEFRARIAGLGQSGAVRVLILGAGLIGCEFADDLAGAGHAVTLVDPNPLPLAALAAPALSQGLRTALEAKGVALRLNTAAARIDRYGKAFQAVLADGTSVHADIVLSAAGLRPDLRLAQQAGIASNRGIIIDAMGRTRAPDVYALGDCAEYTVNDDDARPMPYIAPLMAAARAIARSLTGQATAIDWKPSPVIVKTPCFPLALLPPLPHATANGYWETTMDGDRMICRFYDHADMMVGFGIAPHEAGVRQTLLAALGTPALAAARDEKNVAA